MKLIIKLFGRALFESFFSFTQFNILNKADSLKARLELFVVEAFSLVQKVSRT